MFCMACSRRAALVVAVGRRARGSGVGGGGGGGNGESSSPLKRLLADAGSFGEAAASGEGELQWATQPYTARPQQQRPPPAPAPQDATVLLFPGQGSERVGMGRALEAVPAARDLYALASDVVGWDVWRVCTSGPAAELAKRVQVCVLVTALAALERAREERPAAVQRARAAAGFSLGELAALVFGGALSLEAALRLAELRTAAMAAAAAERPGGMLTVWLSADADVPRLLRQARDHAAEAGLSDPVCSVANYLYPGCKVLAGDDAALSWVAKHGAALGVRRAARLGVGGAWHCALMEATRAPLRAALQALEVRAPRLTVLSCAEGAPYSDARSVRRGLERLAARPVRWEQTLHALFARPRHHDLPLTLALGPGAALRSTLRQVNARAYDNSLQIDV